MGKLISGNHLSTYNVQNGTVTFNQAKMAQLESSAKALLCYTANGHNLRFFENPHPSPLPTGEGDKSRNPCPW
jgi:hypothetical protein